MNITKSLQEFGSRSVPEPTEELDILNEVKTTETPDKEAFRKSFLAMDDNLKWKLSTGTIVEDALFHFGNMCSYEHLSHSFVVDPSDPLYASNKIFTPEELKEIAKTNLKPDPSLPTDFREYINTFNKNSYDELRAQIDESQPWQQKYNNISHGDFDWVRNTVYNLVREYEADSFKKTHLECWYLIHVWRLVDSVFDSLGDVEPIRGESSSLASAYRKNKKRSLEAENSPERKKIGRRCDIIIRSTSAAHGDIKEYGAGEIGRTMDIYGSKFIKENGLKLPKVLRDMFNQLFSLTNRDERKLRQIETIGYIHYGLSFSLLRMDSPKGYCARLAQFPSS